MPTASRMTKAREADRGQHLSMDGPDGTLQRRLIGAIAFMEGWLDANLCFWMGKPVILCKQSIAYHTAAAAAAAAASF